MKKQTISLSLVTELLLEQFPQWSHLSIKQVEPCGWDNRTFRLGDEMLIRLPSSQGYAPQVEKEQKWLPKLAPHLSMQIPKPIGMGRPSKNYPWCWSIYKWIEGDSANNLHMDDLHLQQVASKLAQFLKELHKIDSTEGPPAGAHNYYRGGHPSVYDTETRKAIAELQDEIDAEKAIAIWEEAISSRWDQAPVWVHGDFSPGNILLKDGQLTAIIDFGCIGVGDPACDLMIAWTFLKGESRNIFRSQLSLDPDTWARARGWTLWKALQKTGPEAARRQEIVREILHPTIP